MLHLRCRCTVGACGFATSALGNEIGFEDERRKLEVLVRTAERVLDGGATGSG